jgi:hypothetical protein
VFDKGDGDKRLFAEGVNRTIKGQIRYNGTSAISESINNTIILNSWQHIALTWSQTTNIIKLFHNGTEVLYSNQITGTGVVTDDTAYPFTLGARSNLDSVTLFNGIIDEVHLYDRVLDANDIYPPTDGLPGLIGLWKMDESGSSITITAAPSKTAIFIWSATGIKEKWGQAIGAFFKSIRRQ